MLNRRLSRLLQPGVVWYCVVMLIDERCVPDVIGLLRPEDFYLQQNRDIYETVYTMFNFSEHVDPVTVLDKMKERGVYDEQHSYDYIAQLMMQDIERVLVSEEDIHARIREVGAQISEDYRGKCPILVGVLKGVVPFFAEMSQAITIPVQEDFMYWYHTLNGELRRQFGCKLYKLTLSGGMKKNSGNTRETPRTMSESLSKQT